MLRIYQTGNNRQAIFPIICGLILLVVLWFLGIHKFDLWATTVVAAMFLLIRLERTVRQIIKNHKTDAFIDARPIPKKPFDILTRFGNLVVSMGFHYLLIIALNLFVIYAGYAPDITWFVLQTLIIFSDVALGMPVSLFDIDKKAATLEELRNILESASETNKIRIGFWAVFEDFPLPAVKLDPTKSKFERVNHLASEVLGLDKHVLEGKCFYDLMHPDDIETTRTVMDEVHDHPERNFDGFRNRYKTPSGWRWMEWKRLGGLEFYSVFTDVTEQVEMEEDVRRTRSELIALRKTQNGRDLLKQYINGNG